MAYHAQLDELYRLVHVICLDDETLDGMTKSLVKGMRHMPIDRSRRSA